MTKRQLRVKAIKRVDELLALFKEKEMPFDGVSVEFYVED